LCFNVGQTLLQGHSALAQRASQIYHPAQLMTRYVYFFSPRSIPNMGHGQFWWGRTAGYQLVTNLPHTGNVPTRYN